MLIADDDETVREVMRALVESADGLELVGVAADADEASAMVRELGPDVAVLDLDMPGGGGFAVAHSIQEHGDETRVIALTSIDTPEAQLDILRAGALGFVVKGSPPSQIVDAIRSAARW